MNHATPCLCCRDTMLRHINHSGIYWRCPSCRMEVLDSDLATINAHQRMGLTKSLRYLTPSTVASSGLKTQPKSKKQVVVSSRVTA